MNSLFETYLEEGLLAVKKNDMQSALKYFKLALQENPNESTLHNNLGNIYSALNQPELAVQHYNQALRLNPSHAETYNNLGRIFYKQGLIIKAISFFEKAIRMNKDYWEAHYNLAHSFAKQNRLLDAATHYEEVLKLIPNHPTAHFNLGLLYLDNERLTDAVTHLKEAFRLDESNAEAIRQLGYIYVALGQVPEAIEAYTKALNLLPNASDIHHNLAVLYLQTEDKPNALLHFEQALFLDPKNTTAEHMIAALKGNQIVSKAPSEYIASLFNQYADHYGPHVKKELKYEVPGLLRNALGRVLGPKLKIGRVLDLGCGTGLCGVYFRDLAFELVGIDLSSRMIEKAKELDAYDTLLVADILKYLTDSNLLPFDLIIAADVLVYAGELEEMFKAVSKALLPNGHFVFSIELLEEANHNYSLLSTGRFAHTSSYIRTLAQKNNFILELEETVTLRENAGKPVEGQLFVLTLHPSP